MPIHIHSHKHLFKMKEEFDLLDAQNFFLAVTKLNISQNQIAVELNPFAPPTGKVNAWINKGRQPQISYEQIYECIDRCRSRCTGYNKNFDFIKDLVSNLGISETEKCFFTQKYNSYINQNKSEEWCYTTLLKTLIQMCLNKEKIPTEFLQYDPKSKYKSVIGIGIEHIIAAREDGRVFSTGANDYQQCNTYAWRDVVSVSAGWRTSFGLKKDGTCILIGHGFHGNGEVNKWKNITAIACGTWHIVGLKSDGTVVAFGKAGNGQCDISDWKNIISVAAGHSHTVGLREDGSVIASGKNDQGQCNVSFWNNISMIAASGDHTIGLTKSGKIIATGDIEVFHFDQWTGIVSIATGLYHVVGLKRDGTVIATGHRADGQCDVYEWRNIISIYAGYFKTVGITSDGCVLATKSEYERSSGYTNVKDWKLFEAPGPSDTFEAPESSDTVAVSDFESGESMEPEYCDLCKRKASTTLILLPISEDGTQKIFSICAACKSVLAKHVRNAQLDFVKKSKWSEDKNSDSEGIGTFSENE